MQKQQIPVSLNGLELPLPAWCGGSLAISRPVMWVGTDKLFWFLVLEWQSNWFPCGLTTGSWRLMTKNSQRYTEVECVDGDMPWNAC